MKDDIVRRNILRGCEKEGECAKFEAVCFCVTLVK